MRQVAVCRGQTGGERGDARAGSRHTHEGLLPPVRILGHRAASSGSAKVKKDFREDKMSVGAGGSLKEEQGRPERGCRSGLKIDEGGSRRKRRQGR